MIFYGRSLILGTVGASLEQYPELEVFSPSPQLPDAQELVTLSPDVIIFDLQAAHPDLAFSFLKILPRLVLVGIDPGSGQVFLWSGKQFNSLSTQELVQTIMNTNEI